MALPVCNAQGLPQQRGWKCVRPRQKKDKKKAVPSRYDRVSALMNSH